MENAPTPLTGLTLEELGLPSGLLVALAANIEPRAAIAQRFGIPLSDLEALRTHPAVEAELTQLENRIRDSGLLETRLYDHATRTSVSALQEAYRQIEQTGTPEQRLRYVETCVKVIGQIKPKTEDKGKLGEGVTITINIGEGADAKTITVDAAKANEPAQLALFPDVKLEVTPA